ncbi:MAG: ECF transporter S component [Eubacteriales bacterium]|nr:ECF transporter S component [Eubacteriales bacterium]
MKTNRESLRKMILCAIFCALVVAMTFVPYTGYISVGVIEITTLHIVTILAGVLLGWKYGSIVGFVWGMTCLVRAYMIPIYLPFGFGNPLVSVLPRILVGAVSGLVFGALKKTRLSTTVGIVIATICGSLTNTVLVLTAMSIFVKASVAELFMSIFSTLVGLNGVIEIAAAIVIIPAVYFALQPKDLVLGIDIGASTTKLAMLRGNRCRQTYIKADDESLDEAISKFSLNGVKRIAITGVGASYIEGNIAGISTVRVDEFASLSRGAATIAHKHNCLIVSVGTGTSFVRVTPLRSWHVGGTGIGGGMIEGLSERMLDVHDMKGLLELANKGDLGKVDLQLGDVCKDTISNLSPDSTVANLKKAATASDSDLALGLVNVVFESIGVMAAFAVQKHLTRTIVLVGTIMNIPAAQGILDGVAKLHHVRFIIPQNSPFATAIGAARVAE